MREHNELVDRPFKIRKDGKLARAKCTRTYCTFVCKARHTWWAIKDMEGRELAVVGWGVPNIFQFSYLLGRELLEIFAST